MSAEPDLAAELDSNADLTEWTFTLRDGLNFHDGSALHGGRRGRDASRPSSTPRPPRPARNNVGPIAKVDGRSTADGQFHPVERPMPTCPVTLAYTNARIVPASVISGEFESLRLSGRSAPVRSSSSPTSPTA